MTIRYVVPILACGFFVQPLFAADADAKLCDGFAHFVLLTAQSKEAGESREEILETYRKFERADAIDHAPTEQEKMIARFIRLAIDVVFRHPEMDAKTIAAKARANCTVGKDGTIGLGDL